MTGDSETATGQLVQSPMTGTIYRVTEYEHQGDGKLLNTGEKEEVPLSEVKEDNLCGYCGSNLAVEWSDQGKKQCVFCSPTTPYTLEDSNAE